MNRRFQSVLVIATVLAGWTFFFIPNSTFHVMNLQGVFERMPAVVLFVIIPAALACLVSATASWRAAVVAAVAVPLAGLVTCYFLWRVGSYSDEELLGAWLSSMWSIPAY